ncbi:substrate-binding domain-containing protein [Lacticaseibacillus absianus]|uniref:substrate-binding domain-containing protein n=1 Tax=Lacticaseibacillus absianus TaxID=2729623 RepID=UPI0015CD9350
MAGIREVAKHAQVSATTVSRFLNGDDTLLISDETRARILDAVKALHYVKRAPRGRHTVRFGLFITKSEREEFNDPYFRDIRKGVLDELAKHKLKVETMFHIGDKLDPVKVKGLDALIIVGPLEAQWLKQIHRLNPNLVVVDDFTVPADIDAVFPDFRTAIDQVMTKLHQAGHSRIAFLGGASMYWQPSGASVSNHKMDLRYRAYVDWMREHQLADYTQAFIGEWDYADGAAQAQRLLAHYKGAKLPSALIVASDPLAIGVYRVFHEAGVRIPEDMAIVSFDNSEAAAFLTPSLTSVQLHPIAIGRSAVRMAMERVEQSRDYPQHILMSTDVEYRESFPDR